jgi:arylformamidase
MEFIDISVPISSRIPIWPGNPGVSLEPIQRISQGAAANVSSLSLGTHSGTHVDAPWHFLDQGARADELPLGQLVGPCRVIARDTGTAAGVTAAELQRLAGSPAPERLLLKTGNSELWQRGQFSSAYAHLTPDGAEWIVTHGVRVIGIDYLSIERFEAEGAPVHRTLLGAGVIIIEGLNLADVTPGPYELICLPLRVAGADGAPARVVLRR